jgi:uncharacterized flavoprotein (TIGR03862 family)
VDLAIIGGGPSGLRAAEIAATAGLKVVVFDAKPSVGRKFLVAGKGGLNLTHSEPLEKFSKRYSSEYHEEIWTSLLLDFDNSAMREWARGLGIETFIGTSGRVFPTKFHAAPLLRRWVERLRGLGVVFELHSKLFKIQPQDDRFTLSFNSRERDRTCTARTVILALGGASWPATGSTGEWPPILQQLGVPVTPWSPANCGWEVNWHPDILSSAEGLPLKNITVSTGDRSVAGELLITRYGLEGGALYQLGGTLRQLSKPALTLDLKPSFSAQELVNKSKNYPDDFFDFCALKWKLNKAASSLLKHYAPDTSRFTPLGLALAAKSLTIPLSGPRPIAEAISSAGGVSFSELDESLMIKRLPGLFVAGEMIDWEAPTGGYLLQGCFATGTRAGKGAIQFLKLLGHDFSD